MLAAAVGDLLLLRLDGSSMACHFMCLRVANGRSSICNVGAVVRLELVLLSLLERESAHYCRGPLSSIVL